MRQEAFELHLLLDAAKAPRPFVLVGHSLGALLVRLYTQQYGNEVVGVVLVDPTHEDGRFGQMRPGELQPRLVRLREQATGRVIPEPRREGRRAAEYKPEDDYLAEEFQQIYLSRRANPQQLGDRPLIVLVAGKSDPPPPGVSAELWDELGKEKREQKADLARLSRNSKLVRDPSSGHGLHQDNPPLVARAIEEVVAAASKGTRLVP
jgi:pimeloyl-ACP methyl ester carboxylesterase